MQVRMMSQVLRPGVQYRQHADASAQMAGIGGDLEQGLGSGPKQQAVKGSLVAQCEWRQLLRHGEDDMGVGHRQQACGLFHEPAVTGRGLTLGTVPVAAGVVSDSLIAAAIAPFQMCAERSRTAQADIAQYLPLLVRDGMTPALKELVLVSVKDIGHFEPMFCHAVLFPP